MTDTDRRISDHLVRLVGILFGVVVVQSFVRYDYIVVEPFRPSHHIGLEALWVVYFTVVMSWVDWHTTMELRPYVLNPRNRHRLSELVRLWADLSVVAIYCYLLFTIEPFAAAPRESIAGHLVGYPLIFAAYFSSGGARRLAHGRFASNVGSIVTFGALFALLAGLYLIAHQATGGSSWAGAAWLNASALAEAFFLMVLYRLIRRSARERREIKKKSGKVLGFDVDGVLANQIDGVLPRVKAASGTELGYSDITDWKLPVGSTDIATEILVAMDDPDYILEMEPHLGARSVLEELYEFNRIFIITARPEGTSRWTHQWLSNHAIPFDRMVSVKEEKKSFYRTDILVDDYLGNLNEYLSNTNGFAILIDQPWNRDRDSVKEFIEKERLVVVNSLKEAMPHIKGLDPNPTQ